MIDIVKTLHSLGVTSFVIRGNPTTEEEFNYMVRLTSGVSIDGAVVELDTPISSVITWADVVSKQKELQDKYDAQEYARSRAKEYPPITDYIDGVVKGDQAQIDAYIAACQAVKAKYPKA